MTQKASTILSLQDHIPQLLAGVVSEVLRYTVPIVRATPGNPPSVLGSGVLIQGRSGRYLLSASHILEHGSAKELYIASADRFIRLRGEMRFTRHNDENTNRRTDIWVTRLAPHVVEQIVWPNEFMSKLKLDMNHTVEDKVRYTLFGFPLSQIESRTSNEVVTLSPFPYSTKPAEPKVLMKMGFLPEAHIGLRYRKRWMFDHTGKRTGAGPDLNGLSGSGIWYLADINRKPQEPLPVRLVGILTEWDRKLNAVIATRSNILGDVLNASWDEGLPPSELGWSEIR